MSEMTYYENGDYLIPDLEAPEATQPLGKYGRMRRSYLMENQPILFNSLAVTGKLHTHLLEIDKTARLRLEQVIPLLAEASGVTEALKAADPLRWTGEMNSLKTQAEEIILSELVYS